MKTSCSDPKINNKFTEWAKLTHRSRKLINIDFLTRGAFEVDIADCIDTMKEDFPHKTNKTFKPLNNKLFSVNASSPRLEKEKSDVFHMFTMKFMFLRKKG